MKPRSDYKKRVFGLLKVVDCVEPSDGNNKGGKWLCMCKCRRMITLTGYQLHGRKSCGCLKRKACEAMGKGNKKTDEEKTITIEYRKHRRNSSTPLSKDQWLKAIRQPCKVCGDNSLFINKIELTTDTNEPICRRCKELKGAISIEEMKEVIKSIYLKMIK